jgi:hypothetical protein
VVLWIVIAVIAVMVGCILAVIFKAGDILVAAATIATALGTLALAWQTYALAKATRKTVEESGDQLEELKKQRELLERQADGSTAQAEATSRLAESSSLGALAAARSRIDAISPLIHTKVQTSHFLVFDKSGGERSVEVADEWFEPQLEEVRFEVTLTFLLKNIGTAPANVSFGGESSRMEQVVREGLSGIVIEPGGQWRGNYVVKVWGPDGIKPTDVRMAFTYEGVIYAEMFDRIQWNGQVTPLLLNGGRAKKAERLVHSSGAQVFRWYPRLEEPERIAKQAKFIQDGV